MTIIVSFRIINLLHCQAPAAQLAASVPNKLATSKTIDFGKAPAAYPAALVPNKLATSKTIDSGKAPAAQPAASVPNKLATSKTIDPGQAEAIIQSKLKDISSKKLLKDKILICQEILPLVNPVTKVETKNKIINVITDLFSDPSSMTKPDLTALREFYTIVSKQDLLLAPNQKATVAQWIQIINQLLEYADEKISILANLKVQMKQADYSKAIKATTFAMNLLTITLPPQELDKKKYDSLVGVIRDMITFFFNKRANRPLNDLRALQNILEVSGRYKEIADVVGKVWQSKLTIDISFASAHASTNISDKITNYNAIIQAIDASTDRYEITMLSDDVTYLFKGRSARTVQELESLRDLLNSLISPQMKNKKIFEPLLISNFEEYKKILDATILLKNIDPEGLSKLDSTVIQQKIAEITAVLPNIAKNEAAYEKTLLNKILTVLFNMRSNRKQDYLSMLKTFFEAIEKEGNILDVSLTIILGGWIKVLSDEIAVKK